MIGYRHHLAMVSVVGTGLSEDTSMPSNASFEMRSFEQRCEKRGKRRCGPAYGCDPGSGDVAPGREQIDSASDVQRTHSRHGLSDQQ